MARRKPKAKEGGGSPAWMTTFSDLMSLLLTFFILLFSMSSVSEEKFQAASQSIQTALSTGGTSIIEGSGSASGTGTGESESQVEDAALPPEVQEMYEQVQEYLKENDLDSTLTITGDEKGIYVDIQESILFDSGRAVVKPEGRQTLDKLAKLLDEFDNRVIVEGYTDNVPTGSSGFPTNWELSTERAISVLRYLTEENSLPPERFSATGFGEYNPKFPNDSAENRAHNRRVNIVLVHEPKDVKPNESNSR